MGEPEHIGPILGRVFKDLEVSYSGQAPSVTCGNYQTEEESSKEFDVACELSHLFKIYREVKGETLHPLPGMEQKTFRIDRILAPTQDLRNFGWNKGFIGVELKKSGEKVRKPLSQCLDYLRAAWTLPFGSRILLDYVFLWPLDKCGGPMASIMAQNHIGGCCLKYPPGSEHFRLQFFIGEQSLIVHYPNIPETVVKNLNFGNGMGSR